VTAAPDEVEILLACSSGGHLLQLLALRPAWSGYTCAWVTDDTPDARSLLAKEDVVYAHGPTARSIRNLLRNALLARSLIRRRRPRLIVTTGAALAVPFAWVGRAMNVPVVYVESLTRIDSVSVSCRLAAPAATRLYVQWPELTTKVRRSVYAGAVVTPR